MDKVDLRVFDTDNTEIRWVYRVDSRDRLKTRAYFLPAWI